MKTVKHLRLILVFMTTLLAIPLQFSAAHADGDGYLCLRDRNLLEGPTGENIRGQLGGVSFQGSIPAKKKYEQMCSYSTGSGKMFIGSSFDAKKLMAETPQRFNTTSVQSRNGKKVCVQSMTDVFELIKVGMLDCDKAKQVLDFLVSHYHRRVDKLDLPPVPKN